MEISQHSRENLFSACRLHPAQARHHGLMLRAIHRQRKLSDDLTFVEWIDENYQVVRLPLDDEMSWHRHTRQRATQPSSNFDVDDGQGDRNSQAAVEHVVEITIAWIVVDIAIAAKAQRAKKMIVEKTHLLDRCRGGIKTRTQLLRHLVQHAEVVRNVQVGVLVRGDNQRRTRKIDFIFRQTDDLFKSVQPFFGSHNLRKDEG